jgi:predicted nucleotidyltransferase
MDSRTLEARLREVLSGAGDDVLAAYLFGSLARGAGNDRSDVDIGVLLRKGPSGRFSDLPLDLEGALERAVGREVQLVVLNEAPPDLVHRVLRDGRLLLDRDRSTRIRFEVRMRSLYFDLVPFLDRYRRREAAST